jgi:hypothetical protein
VATKEESNDDPAARELEETRKHADPSRGDKKTKDGQRVSTSDEPTGDNPGN